MKIQSLTFKGLGLLLCLSALINAEEFEFHNKTKTPVRAALGNAANPPNDRSLLVVEPDGLVKGTVNSAERPQFLIIDRDVKYLYQLNAAPGKVVKLKLTTGLFGNKIELAPQLLLNNIKKDEIVLIGSGTAPLPKPTSQKLTPQMLLGVQQDASNAQILGLDKNPGLAPAKAYRQLTLEWHPDKIGTPQESAGAKAAFAKYGIKDPAEQKKMATDVFTVISNAYEKYKKDMKL
jgi:hypothetical protein